MTSMPMQKVDTAQEASCLQDPVDLELHNMAVPKVDEGL